MNGVLLATLLLAAGPAVEVRTVDGRTLAGNLVKLDDAELTVATTGAGTTLAVDALLSLSPKDAPEAPGQDPAARIELTDGSSLAAAEYSVSDGDAKVKLIDGLEVELPVARVANVRFGERTETLAKQWSKLLATGEPDDLLVVARDNALDYHKGIVREVTEDHVQFEFGGRRIIEKRSKVHGLIYYRPPAGTLPEAVCGIVDASGSLWQARTLSLDDRLHWETPAGLSVARPLESIRKIDFSHGKIVYLTDLEPETLDFTPFFGTAKELPVIAEFFGPRRNKSFLGGPLKLGGKVYENGLALHSRTEITYRLPGRFGRLKATAGIDEAVRPHGHVRLVVRADENVLLEETLTGEDEAPLEIDVDLTGARRLSILVDFGDKTDIADHLDLCEARIIK